MIYYPINEGALISYFIYIVGLSLHHWKSYNLSLCWPSVFVQGYYLYLARFVYHYGIFCCLIKILSFIDLKIISFKSSISKGNRFMEKNQKKNILLPLTSVN